MNAKAKNKPNKKSKPALAVDPSTSDYIQILSAVPHPILVINEDNKITYANQPGLCKIAGAYGHEL